MSGFKTEIDDFRWEWIKIQDVLGAWTSWAGFQDASPRDKDRRGDSRSGESRQEKAKWWLARSRERVIPPMLNGKWCEGGAAGPVFCIEPTFPLIVFTLIKLGGKCFKNISPFPFHSSLLQLMLLLYLPFSNFSHFYWLCAKWRKILLFLDSLSSQAIFSRTKSCKQLYIPGSVQGQGWRGSEQPGPVTGVPAQGRELE